MSHISSRGGCFQVEARALRHPEGLLPEGSEARMPFLIRIWTMVNEAVLATALNIGKLVLVLDRSPSMDGPKFQAAKQATTSVIRTADNLDIDVVAFADRPAIIGSARKGDSAGRTRLIDQVNRMNTESATRLDRALSAAENSTGKHDGAQRVVVLSDGQTQGSISDCVASAHRLGQSGIPVDFIATDDVDVDLARQICDGSGGRLEYATQLDQVALTQMFASQAQSLANTAGRNVRVRVEPVPGAVIVAGAVVEPDIIPVTPLTPFMAPVGDLARGEPRSVLVEVSYTSPGSGEWLLGTVEVAGQFGGIEDGASAPLVLHLGAGEPVQDPEVARLYFLLQADRRMTQAAVAPPQQAAALLQQAGRLTRLAGDSRKTRLVQEMASRITTTGNLDDTSRRTLVAAGRRTRVER